MLATISRITEFKALVFAALLALPLALQPMAA